LGWYAIVQQPSGGRCHVSHHLGLFVELDTHSLALVYMDG